MTAPNGCRWCGIEQRGHARQYKAPVGWHAWQPPTWQQIKDRMRARRTPPTGDIVTDPIITDLRRELDKARAALIDAQSHLSAHAHMNAALHCATDVFFSPLHAKVTAAIAGIEHALARTESALTATPTLESRSSDGLWAALAADLDRCQHGRHVGDPCGSCGTNSHGNPHMDVGDVIGYGLRGDPIVMPDRDHKHDPAAWRRTA